MLSIIATGHMGHSATNLSNLLDLGVQGRTPRTPLTVPVHWIPPQVGWMKLNSDGVALGAPSKVAVGGVFPDYTGSVIGAYYFDVGVGTTFFAEISTMIHGIEHAY